MMGQRRIEITGMPPEPEPGSVVLDREGRAWQRVEKSGWACCCTWWGEPRTWVELLGKKAPLVPLVPEQEPEAGDYAAGTHAHERETGDPRVRPADAVERARTWQTRGGPKNEPGRDDLSIHWSVRKADNWTTCHLTHRPSGAQEIGGGEDKARAYAVAWEALQARLGDAYRAADGAEKSGYDPQPPAWSVPTGPSIEPSEDDDPPRPLVGTRVWHRPTRRYGAVNLTPDRPGIPPEEVAVRFDGQDPQEPHAIVKVRSLELVEPGIPWEATAKERHNDSDDDDPPRAHPARETWVYHSRSDRRGTVEGQATPAVANAVLPIRFEGSGPTELAMIPADELEPIDHPDDD